MSSPVATRVVTVPDRWAWAGSREAGDVPGWMRVGPGRAGALHAVTLHLVRCGHGAPVTEIRDEALGGRDADVDAVLDELCGLGVVEPCAANTWRATDMAIRAIE